jgi:hypothetical protein
MLNSASARRRRNLRTLVREFRTLSLQLGETEAAANNCDDQSKLMRIIERSVRKLFQDAGLDLCNENDWQLLIYIVAVGWYSPRRAGRGRVWSEKQTNKLRTDVDNIRKENSEDLTVVDCCKKLAPKYGVAASTLLRKLYPERKKATADRGQIKINVAQAELKKRVGPDFGEVERKRIIEYAMRHYDLHRLAA